MRCGDSDDLGGPVSEDEWEAEAAGVVQSWVDGERSSAGDWSTELALRKTGDYILGRWRPGDDAGGPAHAAAVEATGEGGGVQQRVAGVCGAGEGTGDVWG